MNINHFAELEKIMAHLKPLSPKGKEAAEKLYLTSDESKIIRRLNSIKLARRFLRSKKLKTDKIKYHLKKIPILKEKEEYSADEIFLFKKFINNTAAIFSYLGENEKKFFGAYFNLQDLLNELSKDAKGDEFYISSAYDLELGEVREKIAELEKKINVELNQFYSQIKQETDLDFSGKDFLIVGQEIKQKNKKLLYLETYDNFSFIAKPILNSKLVNLNIEKEELLKREREIELKVLSRLSLKIKKVFPEILSYSKIIEEIDLAFAAATMAEELGLSEPKLGQDKIQCEKAFFPPLKEELDKLNIPYTPLSFSFSKKINVITGSNMGGKTVVLKTLALCQVLAQMGLFVPADSYSAPIFGSIFSMGEEGHIAGLSSFGTEINELIYALNEKKMPKLIFADEFAKTTNSAQGSALFSAIIEKFSKQDVYFFAATHLGEIKGTDETDFLSMKGFNKEKYSSGKNLDELSESERLKLINKHMDYTLIRNAKQKSFYDAFNIASLLGLDREIVDSAIKHLKEK